MSNFGEFAQGPSQSTTDASRVVVLFNEHFSNTATIFATFGNLDCDSSLTSNDNLSEFINDRMPFNVYFTISFTSCESVFKEINSFQHKKATGFDKISGNKLQSVESYLIRSLTEIINSSIYTDLLMAASVRQILTIIVLVQFLERHDYK